MAIGFKTGENGNGTVLRTLKLLSFLGGLIVTVGGIVAWDLTRNAAKSDVDVLTTRVGTVEDAQAADHSAAQVHYQDLKDDDNRLEEQIRNNQADIQQRLDRIEEFLHHER